MNAGSQKQWLSLPKRMLEHMRVPLYRNAYALAASSVSTSVLGMAYWVLAARTYAVDAVGLNTAALAAMIFLGHVAQLNLVNILNRFVPEAGGATGRLIGLAFTICLGTGVLLGAVFIAGVRLWAPEVASLTTSLLFATWFAISTAAWGIFGLQDSVLAGLREGMWVFVKNLTFAVAKIVVLLALPASLPAVGIFVSWTATLLPILLLTMVLLVFLVRRNAHAAQGPRETFNLRQLAEFASGDYIASLLWFASISLLPLLVVQRAGTEANAYFYQAWTITYALYLVSRYFGMALITEGVRDPGRLPQNSYRLFVQAMRLLVPIVAVVVIAAPYILSLFGSAYAAEGTTVLRLMSLSILPDVVITIYLSILRAQSRMRALILTSAAVAVPGVLASYILIGPWGITGVGIGWLATQTALAMVLLLTQLPRLWLPHVSKRKVKKASALVERFRQHGPTRGASKQPAKALATKALASQSVQMAAHWKPQSVANTPDLTLVTVGPAGMPPTAVLKFPRTCHGSIGLQRQGKVLRELHANQHLGQLHSLLPTIIAQGQVEEQRFVLERMLPGTPASHIFTKGSDHRDFQIAAARALQPLHQETWHSIGPSSTFLRRMIDERLDSLRSATNKWKARDQGIAWGDALDRVRHELHNAFDSSAIRLSQVHGDFAIENILVDRHSGQVTGVVDWKESCISIAAVDLVHLVLSMRMATESRDIGDIVAGLLAGERLSGSELGLISSHLSGEGSTLQEVRTLVLLTWLHHVSSHLTKSEHLRNHWLWVSRNVRNVLIVT